MPMIGPKSGKKPRTSARYESFQESPVTFLGIGSPRFQLDADSLNPYYSYSDDHDISIAYCCSTPDGLQRIARAERVEYPRHPPGAWARDPSVWQIWDIKRR